MSGWEYIGLESPIEGVTDMSRVPQWIKRAMVRLYESDPLIFEKAVQGGKSIVLKGRTYRYAIVASGQTGEYLKIFRRRRRRHRGKNIRATALVVCDGEVLLVQGKGRRRFSLPGGAIGDRESAEDAVVRHLEAQTGLTVNSVHQALYYESRFNRHVVFGILATGEIKIARKKLDAYEWWDGCSELPVRRSAVEIAAGAGMDFGRSSAQ